VLNGCTYHNELDTLVSNCRSQLSLDASFNLAFTQNQANKVGRNFFLKLSI